MTTLLKLLTLLGCFLPCVALAQAPADTTRLMCLLPVEPMPELPGGGGNRSIVAAIQGRLVYPPSAVRAHVAGRVFVSFVVTATGEVREARVVKGLRADCDRAALRAVLQLPRFRPAQQHGKPMATGLTVPVHFRLPARK